MPTDRPIPPLLAGLIDDAAVFPPGNLPLPEAVAAHVAHRSAWYADLVGPLLVPASALESLPGLAGVPRLGVVGDTGVAGLPAALAAAAARGGCAQVEVAVAKRGEDPLPGLRAVLAQVPPGVPGPDLYAELPLTGGLMEALDLIAARRSDGAQVAPKFRTGGLAAELFPTPVELAAVIAACQERALPFKLTAGLHRALRQPDPDTGLIHHGFLNVLAGCLTAAAGAEVADVAELLGEMDPVAVVAVARSHLDQSRPLWISYGSCQIDEPVADLIMLGLLAAAPR